MRLSRSPKAQASPLVGNGGSGVAVAEVDARKSTVMGATEEVESGSRESVLRPRHLIAEKAKEKSDSDTMLFKA